MKPWEKPWGQVERYRETQHNTGLNEMQGTNGKMPTSMAFRLEKRKIFFNQPLLVLRDTEHSWLEKRFHALGKTDGNRMLHISPLP